MAIQCNIIYNEDNTINYVQTENGERSLLFDNLVQTVGDKEKALEFYALTESEDFKTSFRIPTIEDVILYATSTQKELTSEQKIDLQDVIMGLGVNNSFEAEDILTKALESNGIITFNKNRMISSGAFNTFEAEQIVNSLEKQNEIKEVFKALKNTDLVELDYPKNFIYTEGTELNSFGKQKIKNPYILQQEIINNQETPEGIRDISELYEGVKSVPQNTIIDGELVEKTNGSETKQILENTLIDDANPRLAENLNFITEGFSPTVWESKKESVAKIVEQIKEDAKDNGLDLKNIEEKVFTKSRQEIIDFFNAMENMLETGNVENFAVLYNEIFDLNTPLTSAIKTDNEFDIVLEDNITEYEAFSKYNLLKKAPNIYRKVEDMSLERMYEITAINKGETVEQIKKEIQGNPLDVVDFEVDVEILEKMQLYKNYFGFSREIMKQKDVTQDRDYIQKTNKWLLKSGNPYFKITKNGLELISEDLITKERGELTLPNYLKTEQEQPIVEEDINKIRRSEVYNNPLIVKKLKSDYLYVDNLTIAVKNSTDSFIRTPKGVFELTYTLDNISFYGLLESASEKPLSDINFKSFDYLSTSPELFKKAKNYYSKTELEEINSENFNCG